MPTSSSVQHPAPEHGRELGRQRVRDRTDRKLADATMRIALQRGVDAVTIEEVSRISGVAKTTIYRRFRNRQELLEGIASREMLRPLDMSRTSFDAAGIAELIGAAVREFDGAFGVKAVGQVMSSDSGFFHDVVSNLLGPVRDRIVDYFKRGAQAHRFRRDLDLDFILDLTLGGMVATAALHDGVPHDWPRRMADFLWPHIEAVATDTADATNAGRAGNGRSIPGTPSPASPDQTIPAQG